MSFAGHLSDVMLQIATAAFKTMLWVPEFGWDAKETDAAEDPHPPQVLAAAQCFLAFFVKPIQRTWIHLAAEMQAGKTGVVTALIRLILSNADKLKIRPNRIFVLTGMGDNAWKKQTRTRLPQSVRNVHHSGGLVKVVEALRSLAAGGELSNVFIILDESHLAAAANNRPSAVYAEVALLCPREKWQENNIRFLTISATDPAKVLMVKEKEDAQVVRLQTTDDYQSVQKLNLAGRIRFAEEYGNLDSDKAIAELKRCVTESFSDAPRYHLVRARYGKQDTIMGKLRTAFPDAEVLKFDSEEKITKRTSGGDDSSTALEEIEDINEMLEVAPEKHTFIVLKNMFYAAKTLEDKFVGVLYDRMGNKDDTNLQSLLGRACGYGKSSRTIVYTSKQTVENYIGCWCELCADPRFAPTLEGIPVSKIDKKMTGVRVRKVGGEVVFTPTSVVGPGVAAAAAGGNTTKHDNCVVAVEEFATMDLLNARWRAISGKDEKLRTPNRSEGDYVCSIGKKSEKQTASNVRAFITGSTKGWGSGLTAAADGELVSRVYAGYENGAPIFFLRWTRKA